ncbi:MAG: hypothetical protein ACK5KO_13335 [Arachnia sp.]
MLLPALVVGCAGVAPAPVEAEPASSKAPQSFPPAPEGESAEARQIRAAWEAFERTVDDYYTDPELVDWAPLGEVSRGLATAQASAAISGFRSRGVVQAGSASFYDVDIAAPSVNHAGVRVSAVTYCLDTSQLRIVDIETRELEALATSDPLPYRVMLEILPDQKWWVTQYADGSQTC